MTSPLQTPELRNAYEWEHLDEISHSVGNRLVRSLVGVLSQEPIPGTECDRLYARIRERIVEKNPYALFVDSDLFDEFRYQAGVLASGLSDEKIDAALGSDMWDQVQDELRSQFTDTETSHYELALTAHVITPEAAAQVFAIDYREIAENRLNGFKLIHLDDADDAAVLEEQDAAIALQRRVDESMWDDWDSDCYLENEWDVYDDQGNRKTIPDWLEEEMHGFIGTDGTYDHTGFIEYLWDSGYPYADVDERNIQEWGMQLAQNLRQEQEEK